MTQNIVFTYNTIVYVKTIFLFLLLLPNIICLNLPYKTISNTASMLANKSVGSANKQVARVITYFVVCTSCCIMLLT